MGPPRFFVPAASRFFQAHDAAHARPELGSRWIWIALARHGQQKNTPDSEQFAGDFWGSVRDTVPFCQRVVFEQVRSIAHELKHWVVVFLGTRCALGLG